MTDTETVLFIGGPADGKRLPVTRGCGVWNVSPKAKPVIFDDDKPVTLLEPVVYTRQRIVLEGVETLVFAQKGAQN